MFNIKFNYINSRHERTKREAQKFSFEKFSFEILKTYNFEKETQNNFLSNLEFPRVDRNFPNK